MGFQVQWTIEGEKQLSRILLGMETGLSNFKKPLDTIARNLVSLFTNEVFQTRGGVIQESWASLSPYTLATKARRGLPAAPLIATGAMQHAFKSAVTSDQAIIYNTADYFKYHQSNQPRKKLPRRVMMKIANKQKEMIVKEFQDFIRTSAKQNV